MLYFILSTVGGGKTTHITSLMNDFSKANEKMTLIVPEQFTFMSEKLLLEKLGSSQMAKIDVVSFTKLSEKLLGKPAIHERLRLSDSSAAVLMRKAMLQVKDELNLFKKNAGSLSSTQQFISLSSEFKQNAVSPDEINEFANGLPDGILKLKLNDISKVLSKFDSLSCEKYFNPDDLINEFVRAEYVSAYFRNRIVFLDAFHGFTKNEINALEVILKSAKSVYVTLCTDDLENSDDVTDLFAHTKKTALLLKGLAKKNNVPVAVPLFLSKGGKYNNFPPHFTKYFSPELNALKSVLFDTPPKSYTDSCENIKLCKADDIYSECDYVACTIKKLIRSEGKRKRDFAIIARDITDYDAPLRAALRKYKIDAFEDFRVPVSSSPVINLFTGVISIITKGFETESILKILKTGLISIDELTLAQIENYAVLWQINRKDWLSEFKYNPNGIGKISEEELNELNKLNQTRECIINPLLKLKDAVQGSTGKECAKALFDYLIENKVNENLKILAENLSKNGENALVTELERMWDLLMSILNEFALLYSDEKLTFKEIYDIFTIMLNIATIGNLPTGLDEVTIGSADRVRTNSPKVVFIIGCDANSFPKIKEYSSALSGKDRAILRKYGMELSSDEKYVMAQEKLIAYTAFCCAREKLFVTYSAFDSAGNKTDESEYYGKIKKFYTNVVETEIDALPKDYFIETEDTAFEQYAKMENSDKKHTLDIFLRDNKDYSSKMVALDRAKHIRDFQLQNTETAKNLFGETIWMSASRIDSYYKCPFDFFCQYGIKLYTFKPVEHNSLLRGNVIHEALCALLTDYTPDSLKQAQDDEIKTSIHSYISKYAENNLEGYDNNERFIYLLSKLENIVFDIAKRLIFEFEKSKFVPIDLEKKIGDGDTPAYQINFPTGVVKLTGAVDRVDMAEIGDEKYIRVIDYKSGGKKFELSDTIQGLNLQMLIYLFALWKSNKGKYKNVLPAGVLYYNAKSPIADVDNLKKPTVFEQRLSDTKMSGIILENSDVILAMDSDADGTVIPASIGKDGIKGSLIKMNDLEKLKEKADSLIKEMAMSLHEGKIEALPACKTGEKPKCSFCEYQSICAYEKDIKVREIFKVNNDEVIAILNDNQEKEKEEQV